MYFRTSSEAPRYKVMRVALANPDLTKAETMIAAGRDVVVSLAAAQDALYVTQRRGVHHIAACAASVGTPGSRKCVTRQRLGVAGRCRHPASGRGRVARRLDAHGQAVLRSTPATSSWWRSIWCGPARSTLRRISNRAKSSSRVTMASKFQCRCWCAKTSSSTDAIRPSCSVTAPMASPRTRFSAHACTRGSNAAACMR